MISGTKARNDAKTKSSTARAPSGTEQRLGQHARPRRCRRRRPAARRTSARRRSPAAAAACSSTGCTCASMPGPEALRQRALDQRERAPAVVGDEPVVAGAGLGRRSGPAARRRARRRRRRRCRPRARPRCCPAGTVTTGTRVSAVLVAERVDQLLLGLVAGLAGQREVEGQPVGDPPATMPPATNITSQKTLTSAGGAGRIVPSAPRYASGRLELVLAMSGSTPVSRRARKSVPLPNS